MTSIYERLKNLQITLPGVLPVVDGYVAAFVPFDRTGNLIHLSGLLAKKNGKLWCGKLGEEIPAIIEPGKSTHFLGHCFRLIPACHYGPQSWTLRD
jgi:hypothetical protein